MSKTTEFIPIGIDLGSIHARVAIGNLTHHKNPAAADGLVDTRPLPDIISNAQGSRYTLALVGTDNAGGETDGENNAEVKTRHIFGEAARRSLARENKPAISNDLSPMVRELVRSSSSSIANDDEATAKASKASAFFSHLADLACDASSSHPAKLRTVVSVPVASTPEEQSAIVRVVERGINDALLSRLTTKEAKQMRKKKGDEEDPFVMAVITDPAAVCVAHGLTETEHPRVIDLAESNSGAPSNHWKHALVVDWGASGLTATHVCRRSPNSSIITVEKHVTETACSGTAIVTALAAHCASMFERKSRVSGVLDSKKAFHRLEVACESAVRTLSRAPTVTVAVDGLFEGIDMNVPISRPRFDMLMSGILRQAENLLQAFAADEAGSIEFDVVLLAGNVCDMPSASNLIRNKLFPNANVGRGDVPPDEAVAIGCARHAASILSCDTHSRQGVKSAESSSLGQATRTVKACPLTIGICRIENGKEGEEFDDVISKKSVSLIEAGEPLPANVTKTITYTNGDASWLTHSYIGIVQMQAAGGGNKSKLIGKIEAIPSEDKSFEITMELTSAGELTLSVNGGPSANL
jgi:molecular chaperone DnaK (HSP70)